MTTTQKAVLLHPMGSMGEEIQGQDDLREFWCVRCGDCPPRMPCWHGTCASHSGRALPEVMGRAIARREHGPVTVRKQHLIGATLDAEESDRAEVERINLTGARYRESVRLEKHGELPWDFSASEAS